MDNLKKLNRKRGKLLHKWHTKYMLVRLEDASKKELEEIIHGYQQAMRLHYEYNCYEQQTK